METQTLKVEVFRKEDGSPTCCALYGAEQCRFLYTRRFGSVDLCGATSEDLQRDESGWLVPVERCPLWRET